MNKLLIRHLPDWFTPENTTNFLKDYGAIDVITFDNKGKMKCCAFARFTDESSTLLALRNLHQLELFGNRLVVEFAKDKKQNLNIKDNLNDKKNSIQLNSISNSIQLNELNKKYLDLPLIDFKYPPASEIIIKNISKSLLNNQQFYNQVLYLMSKMNLPPPFINTDLNLNEQFSLNNIEMIKLNNKINQSDEKNLNNKLNDKMNELDKLDENDEDINKLIYKLIKLKKRKLEANNLNDKKKKLNETNLINDDNIIEYFDNYKIDLKYKNKIQIDKELKLNFNNLDNEINEGFGKFNNDKSIDNELNQNNSSIKSNKLINNCDDNLIYKSIEYKQLNKDELNNYKIFKDYSIGEPSCRLYIKNVDKKVTENELKLIYLNLLDLKTDEQLNSFNINLFKKGKMNGQAFISLLNEDLAKEAIDKTNGLIINNKPIVVCFARSKIKDLN